MKTRTMMKTIALILAVLFLSAPAMAADTIKIAFIDPLTGPFANVGDMGLKHFIFAADRINANGGVLGGKQLEMVPFDSKVSPKESLIQLQRAIDQGIQYVIQGNGSAVTGALMEAIAKHNKRYPDQQVLLINHAAVTPAFTEEKCDFWHFRTDAHVTMKIKVIADYLTSRPDIKKIYLINQDYVFGHSVSAAAKEYLAKMRPDIEIVGDDFHPIGKIKDFSPYITKIRSSGAQGLITGNWGNDMTLLIKAGTSAGLDLEYYTFYAGGLGGPTAIGEAGIGKVYQVTEFNNALCIQYKNKEDEDRILAFKEKYGEDIFYLKSKVTMDMLAMAMDKAGNAKPKDVAYALEGMEIDGYYGKTIMRAQDHQLLQPMFMSRLVKQGDGFAKYDMENTGMGWETVYKVDAVDTAIDSPCDMKRP
ncbi:branched-chain amino acid ABC transporter substrate-binding protein [Desulfatibacillum aliphaticivorans]|uniref:branched-chain amino acid ABC transporter substrate-binding protein n=1 Tax=Desulfatibacillum aliphaticivorans TaxID=218208 RepID=UPI000412525D|nr:branched-chain amino acid ABC transporter substrate-binding protein [Desulfatibacillum aliphaticivorans]